MKKLLLLMFVVVLTATKTFADYGWYDGSMIIGGITTDVTGWSTEGDNPTDLGFVSDMTITSIAFKVWSDANDRGGANMYFRIWDGGPSQVGDDQDLWLGAATRIAGDHDYFISWTGTEDLASAVGLTLEAGKTYYIDMWAKTYGASGDQWYSGNNSSNYHAKLIYRPNSYTRTVTSGKFGTICLPFAATVTGATVFKITSKVMNGDNLAGINLESVETLEAGKAYIFKATASELTATFSGAPAEATEAYGMFGNLSSEKVTVPEGNYVVGTDNLIHKVVSVDGVTIGQYKGYITLNGINAAGARGANFMSFQDETTTSIESISMDSQNEVFNLQGQRVKNAQKGLFIVNGKKVLVK